MWRVHPNDFQSMGIVKRSDYYNYEISRLVENIGNEVISIVRQGTGKPLSIEAQEELSNTIKLLEEKFGINEKD